MLMDEVNEKRNLFPLSSGEPDLIWSVCPTSTYLVLVHLYSFFDKMVMVW